MYAAPRFRRSPVTPLALAVLQAFTLPACHRFASGSGDGGTKGTDNNANGSTATPPVTPTVAAFGLCFADECAKGLTCAPWGASSYCLLRCANDGACAANDRCSGGYCLHKVSYYDICAAFDACPSDALCAALAQLAPTRCTPVCEVGSLTGFGAVTSCPALPAGVLGAAPTCTAGMLSTSTAKFCTAEVATGERCDQFAWRCNDDATRPDTDTAHGPSASGGPDPGALRCLPRGSESSCLRVCTLDGRVTTSPCACPTTDPLCTDPSDPGLGWVCAHWSELALGLGACVPLETCTDDTACADNARSGLSKCKPSPYDGVTGSVCQRP